MHFFCHSCSSPCLSFCWRFEIYLFLVETLVNPRILRVFPFQQERGGTRESPQRWFKKSVLFVFQRSWDIGCLKKNLCPFLNADCPAYFVLISRIPAWCLGGRSRQDQAWLNLAPDCWKANSFTFTTQDCVHSVCIHDLSCFSHSITHSAPFTYGGQRCMEE